LNNWRSGDGWMNIGDAVHGTISYILSITERDKNKKEAEALFENIRDDIWALFEETNK
jgi:hypothetical protein